MTARSTPKMTVRRRNSQSRAPAVLLEHLEDHVRLLHGAHLELRHHLLHAAPAGLDGGAEEGPVLHQLSLVLQAVSLTLSNLLLQLLRLLQLLNGERGTLGQFVNGEVCLLLISRFRVIVLQTEILS